MSKYNDFEEENVIWMFTEEGKYEKIRIKDMIAGDTDSAYMKVPEHLAKTNDLELIRSECDALAKKVDDAFPMFSEMAFNCPPERNRSIRTDREVVSDKSLFLTKKRYIMHVVDNEGEACDKLKIMGVEMKKADTSPAVKVMLRELVDAILDGVSMEDTHKMIRRMKNEFSDRFTLQEIARTSSCKTLKKIQEQIEATGNDKGAHYTVRAALFYNSKCTKMDRKVMPGDKVKIIYIKHPDCKYMGWPVDLEELPEWFKDYPIDYETEWKKANTKITNYLKSVGWDLESRKSAQREELFGF